MGRQTDGRRATYTCASHRCASRSVVSSESIQVCCSSHTTPGQAPRRRQLTWLAAARRMLGYAITRNANDRERGALLCSDGSVRTWTDTALVKAGSAGLGMHMEGEGGSGRESSGEGNCRRMHIAVYLKSRVGSCTAEVVKETEHRRGDAPGEQVRQPPCRAAVPAQPGKWW
jgi:hypothetical protein